MNTLSVPAFKEIDKMDCDKLISEKECQTAISQLADNKSPGLDGFSIEFCKTFWNDIKGSFMNCINYSILKNELCESQYQGVITLFPKPGKDLLDASNYRPITLLNSDYKTISKVNNNRLYPFLPWLIKNDQNGFIKHRNIGDNIRLMFDIIDYTNYRNASGAVLFRDLHKAFDSLKCSFIFAMQKSYGSEIF